MKVCEAVNYGIKTITHLSDTARLDTEILLGHIISKSRVYLRTWPDYVISKDDISIFKDYIKRRSSGEPVAYILGYQYFWGIKFTVDNNVLIPRPETETIIETILSLFPETNSKSVLELGTGSGAISCALAVERPTWPILAIDISDNALEITKKNISRYELYNISIRKSCWFSNIGNDEKFNIIVSNPPYIDHNDDDLCSNVKKYEPINALIPKSGRGLDDIKDIICHGQSYLRPDGYLFIEHGFKQGAQVRSIFLNFNYYGVNTVKDTAGMNRVTYAQYKA